MTARTPWLAIHKPNSRAAVRLFCFPYAGGGDSIFREWPEVLPDTIEVCPVQLPGRGARASEPPFTQVSPLVQAASVALAPRLDKPFALFGHSMGAVISFELARQLRRDYALQPVHLFVSGRCSPQTVDKRSARDLSDSELVEVLLRFNGTPKEAFEDPELLQLILPVIRADFTVGKSYTYAPEPPLDCAITVFGGLLDPTTDRDCIEGWREHTKGRFLVRMFPGDHFFLNTMRSLLLEAIIRDLHQYLKDST
jgi:medium-chain acyl-[acyl-carrier-protein] hydrolase